jgi:hypothetical protein
MEWNYDYNKFHKDFFEINERKRNNEPEYQVVHSFKRVAYFCRFTR